jgi:beta-lactamase superfamily II metal-dependent hydrolase
MAVKRKNKNTAARIGLIAAAVLLLAFIGWYDRTYSPGEAAATDIPAVDDGLTVVFIDVGQGDSILVGDGSDWILVDAGPPEAGDDVVEELRLRGVASLRMVVATHPHSDHIGGLADVLTAFAVEELYMPRVVHDTPTFEALMDVIDEQNRDILTPHPGESIAFPGMRIMFLSPPEDAGDNLNDASVVLRVDSRYGNLLLTGDISADIEKNLLDSGYDLTADILKVAHHGSDSSSSKAFLKAVNPRLAVIMCGINNSYNHPSGKVLNQLQDLGIDIYRTDRNGTVTVTMTGDGVDIKTER